MLIWVDCRGSDVYKNRIQHQMGHSLGVNVLLQQPLPEDQKPPCTDLAERPPANHHRECNR